MPVGKYSVLNVKKKDVPVVAARVWIFCAVMETCSVEDEVSKVFASQLIRATRDIPDDSFSDTNQLEVYSLFLHFAASARDSIFSDIRFIGVHICFGKSDWPWLSRSAGYPMNNEPYSRPTTSSSITR